MFDKDTKTKGWQCDISSKKCLPLNQICDRNEDCHADKSDEEIGCNLYPGNHIQTKTALLVIP